MVADVQAIRHDRRVAEHPRELGHRAPDDATDTVVKEVPRQPREAGEERVYQHLWSLPSIENNDAQDLGVRTRAAQRQRPVRVLFGRVVTLFSGATGGLPALIEGLGTALVPPGRVHARRARARRRARVALLEVSDHLLVRRIIVVEVSGHVLVAVCNLTCKVRVERAGTRDGVI